MELAVTAAAATRREKNDFIWTELEDGTAVSR
jgi:hypothetical protein